MENYSDDFEGVIIRIEKQATIYLSTIDGDIPRVRPVTMVSFGSRHFILTGANDAKIDQIMKNNMVEACYSLTDEKGNGYIRMDGKIDIIDDMQTKREVADQTDYLKEYWSTPEDPTYALLEFHIKNIEYLKPGDNYAKKFSM
jgi:uncharacterized pyridoxamine 5'-phosphate oxidase family protein